MTRSQPSEEWGRTGRGVIGTDLGFKTVAEWLGGGVGGRI